MLLLLLALPAGAGVKGEVGPYRIDLSTKPETIPVGSAQLVLRVTDAAGKPAEGLTIKTLARMPGMNMGEREVVANAGVEPGVYTAQAVFAMGGAYTVDLQIEGSQGSAKGAIPLKTGQNTGAGESSSGLLSFVPWLIGVAIIVSIVARMRATGQKTDVKAAFNRGTIGGLLLLGVLLAGAVFAVRNWRRPGSMTPIEAQVMEMNTPPPPGTTAVELAPVKRSRIAETVSYSGQAVGFVEQDVVPRVTGTILEMPVYVGDRVKKGQLLARLDTTQLDPQVAERAAMTAMAAQGVNVASAEYQTAVQEIAEARAEATVRESAISETEAMVTAAEQDKASMQAEVIAAESEAANARAEVTSAEQNRQYLSDELKRARMLYDEKLLSRSDLQKAEAEAADAEAKVRQAEGMVRGADSKVTAARAGVRKAEAMLLAAKKRVQQAKSEFQAAKTAILSKQRAAEAAKRNIAREQAGVAQAKAGQASAAAQKGYALLRAEVDGVVTQRLISPGTLVNPGQAVLRVAQISPIRLQANVASVDLQRMRPGSPVTIMRGEGGENIQASLTSVSPAVDAQSRTGVAEVLWPNPAGRFLPGQFLTMSIQVGGGGEALSIPLAAVQKGGFVWVADAGTSRGLFTVRRVKVEVGASDGENVAILQGLSEGQMVVTTGAGFMREGGEVTAELTSPVADGQTIEVFSSKYEPSEITAEAGKPLKLTFIRRSDQGCGTEIVFPDLKIQKKLPLNEPVLVEFTPEKSGTLRFTCGMDMFEGKVIVK